MNYLRIMLPAFLLIFTAARVTSQQDIGFREATEYDTGDTVFEDRVVDELLDVYTALLNQAATAEDFEREARIHFWRLTNRLTLGRLTPTHRSDILARLEAISDNHSGYEQIFEHQQWVIGNLMIGDEAPDISGSDMNGIAFHLSDYRGRIVVLVFTGHWCGPCRSEYPYQRLLLEVMVDEPVALLGVNSDESVDIAVQAKKEERLEYRTWWDGHAEDPRKGPIATAWNIVGWPSIYIIDDLGSIRFKGKRHEEVITAVKRLLDEMRRRGG